MFHEMIDAHIRCLESIRPLASILERAGRAMRDRLVAGNKLMICGNGGSAADAQHFAAEIVGRFETDRRAYPAVALTTDTSILTAVGNDYGYDEVFARQVTGLGRKGDVLIGISTSGRSPNVLRAVECARQMEIMSVGLLGKDGGDLKDRVDQAVVVADASTARIQETHIFILHYWAWVIEKGLPAADKEESS